MPKVLANGIEIEFETFGDSAADPLLLVMGLGGQLIHWHTEFCEQLAAHGHFVIRYDNRDVGLSTWFDEAGTPDLLPMMKAVRAGEPVDVPYTLADMANDGMGLLSALSIERAHICGVSMGGMIVQRMAIDHPERVKTMTSIMSTTGNPDLPPAAPEVMAKLLAPPPRNLEESIDRAITMSALVGSPAYPATETELRETAELAFQRAFHPEGTARHLAAITADGSREEGLKALATPSLVIHGRDDALVPFTSGVATAEAIPGAQSLWIEGMGHDMPRALWDPVIVAIHERACS
ncbi:MAG: alpha/beta fold hydrolase [Myxococcota bacterium]|nr:alpha/beta fold hydrolase [Myxococcota bacterium]